MSHAPEQSKLLSPEALLGTPRVSPGALNCANVVSHSIKRCSQCADASSSALCLSDAAAWSASTKQVSAPADSVGGPGIWSDCGQDLFFLKAAQLHVLPSQGSPYALTSLPEGIAEIASVDSSCLSQALPFHDVQCILASFEIYDVNDAVSVHPQDSCAPDPADAVPGSQGQGLLECSSDGILAASAARQKSIASRKAAGEDWVALDAAPVRHWDSTDLYRSRTHTALLVLAAPRSGAGSSTSAGAGATQHLRAQGMFARGAWGVAACLQLTGSLCQQDCPGKPWGGLAECVHATLSKTCTAQQDAQVLDEWVLDVAAVFRNTGFTAGHSMMASTAVGVHSTQVPLGAVLRTFAEQLPADQQGQQGPGVPCSDLTHRWSGAWELLTADRPTLHASPVHLRSGSAVHVTAPWAAATAAEAPGADMLLWTAMERAGYESDSMRLVVFHSATRTVIYRGTDVDVSLGPLHPLGSTSGPDGTRNMWVLSTAPQHGTSRALLIRIAMRPSPDVATPPAASVAYHWLALPGNVDSISARVQQVEGGDATQLPSSLDVRLVFRSCSMLSPHELLSASLRCPPEDMDVNPASEHPAKASLNPEQLSEFSSVRAGICLSSAELRTLCPDGVPATQSGQAAAATADAWPYGVPSHALPEVDVPLVDSVTRVCASHCDQLSLGERHSVWFVGGNHAGRRGPSGEWLPQGESLPGRNEWNDALMHRGCTALDAAGAVTGDAVHAWVLTPPGVSTDIPPSTPLPVVMLVHGGPQGAWGDSWHYRWHPQTYAAAGYIVLAVNFHGSSSFGQAFQDAVTGDWGGAPQLDNMLGLRWLLQESPWAGMADPQRVVAAGASFGGYSVNWLNGHTQLL